MLIVLHFKMHCISNVKFHPRRGHRGMTEEEICWELTRDVVEGFVVKIGAD